MKRIALMLSLFVALLLPVAASAGGGTGYGIGWGLNSGGQRCTYAQCLITMYKGDGVTTIAQAQVSANAYTCNSAVIGNHTYNFGTTAGFGWGGCASPNANFGHSWSCAFSCDTYNTFWRLRETCPNGISYKWSPKKPVTLVATSTVDGGTFRTDSAPGCQTINLADYQVTKAALRQMKLRRAYPNKRKPSDLRERLRKLVRK